MDNKTKQIKYNQLQYYKLKYKMNKAIKDVNLQIKNGDIYSKIISNIIHRHNKFLIDNNIITEILPMKLLGCNKHEFIDYINSKLKENMKLENYGEWEIDHIYPISKFNLKD